MANGNEALVLAAIRRMKSAAADAPLLVRQLGRSAGWLLPMTHDDADSPSAIALLTDWRRAAADAFPSQFRVTEEGTCRWLKEQVLEIPDRLLFWVADLDGTRVGHVGLYRYDAGERHVEIDNVIRGVHDVHPGLMQAAISALLDWTFAELEMETVFLRVFSDNERALRLYERCGFAETMRMPLARVVEDDVTRWVEVDGSYRQPVKRYFVTMALPREGWQGTRKRGYAA